MRQREPCNILLRINFNVVVIKNKVMINLSLLVQDWVTKSHEQKMLTAILINTNQRFCYVTKVCLSTSELVMMVERVCLPSMARAKVCRVNLIVMVGLMYTNMEQELLFMQDRPPLTNILAAQKNSEEDELKENQVVYTMAPMTAVLAPGNAVGGHFNQSNKPGPALFQVYILINWPDEIQDALKRAGDVESNPGPQPRFTR